MDLLTIRRGSCQRLRMRRVVIGLVAAVFTCACSSGYEPAKSPRIAIVVEGGSPTFVKNGEHFGNSAFASGLVRAVNGNARAEEQALTARSLVIGGFVLDVAGLGSEVGGFVALGHDSGANGHSSALPAALLLGGIGAVVAGTLVIVSAQPHVYDAVNIYNDGVDASPH